MINNVISTFLKKTREKGGKKGEKEEKEGKNGREWKEEKKGGEENEEKEEKKSLVRLQLWLQQAEQGLCLSTAVFEVEYYRDKSLFVRHSLK